MLVLACAWERLSGSEYGEKKKKKKIQKTKSISGDDERWRET